MAKPTVAGAILDGLTWEQQYQQLPEYPTRPMLFPEDFPTGELASMAEAKFQGERGEREYQLRAGLSGYNATPWANCGPQTPAERELELERDADRRRYANGLPDSSPEDSPRQSSGRPF